MTMPKAAIKMHCPWCNELLTVVIGGNLRQDPETGAFELRHEDCRAQWRGGPA